MNSKVAIWTTALAMAAAAAAVTVTTNPKAERPVPQASAPPASPPSGHVPGATSATITFDRRLIAIEGERLADLANKAGQRSLEIDGFCADRALRNLWLYGSVDVGSGRASLLLHSGDLGRHWREMLPPVTGRAVDRLTVVEGEAIAALRETGSEPDARIEFFAVDARSGRWERRADIEFADGFDTRLNRIGPADDGALIAEIGHSEHTPLRALEFYRSVDRAHSWRPAGRVGNWPTGSLDRLGSPLFTVRAMPWPEASDEPSFSCATTIDPQHVRNAVFLNVRGDAATLFLKGPRGNIRRVSIAWDWTVRPDGSAAPVGTAVGLPKDAHEED